MSDKKKVCGHLMGGLGNQIFQIFATISYALEFNRDFIFGYSKRSPGSEVRYTFWDTLFKHIKKYTTFENIEAQKEISTYPKYKVHAHHYQKFPENSNNGFILFGFFQSDLYFKEYYNQILELIKFDELLLEVKNKYNNYFDSDKICSMHFRVGDYKWKQDCHPVMTYDYYNKAIKELKNKTEIKKIIYFYQIKDKEHIEKIVEKLKNENKDIEFQGIDHSIEDWEQLLLMSLCNHNIIANSSFSWWGAYFNKSSNKIVIYPEEWFGWRLKRNHNLKDAFPNNWIKITDIKLEL